MSIFILISLISSLSDDIQVDIIEAFNSASRYLDDLLNIDPYFEGMLNQMYPPELQLNKANTSDTEAPFLYSHLSIANIFSFKIYDKRDDFDCIFSFLDGISQLIRFARVCSHVEKSNRKAMNRNWSNQKGNL